MSLVAFTRRAASRTLSDRFVEDLELMTISTNSEQKRLRWLLRIFVVLLVVVCLLFYRDNFLRESLALPSFTASRPTLNDLLHPQEQEKRDPELGTTLPENATGAALRAAVRPGKSGYLLIFVGDCTGCLKVDFPRWAKKARQHNVQLVALTQVPRERIGELQSQLNQLNVQAPIVSDPKVEVISAINSYYGGRAYLFSPRWQLEWMAHTLNSDVSFWDTPAFLKALEEARQAR